MRTPVLLGANGLGVGQAGFGKPVVSGSRVRLTRKGTGIYQSRLGSDKCSVQFIIDTNCEIKYLTVSVNTLSELSATTMPNK